MESMHLYEAIRALIEWAGSQNRDFVFLLALPFYVAGIAGLAHLLRNTPRGRVREADGLNDGPTIVPTDR